MTDIETVRGEILDAALPHIAFEGWSRRALAMAVRDAGHEPIMLDRAFPRGGADALALFWRRADQAMATELAETDLDALKIRERIATGVKLRLAPWADHREAVRHALGLLALPRHAGLGLRLMAETVDAIWHAAGDRSTDFNYYTKRLLLAGVLSSTLLYWLDDQSEQCAETWAFLDRRIGDVMRIQKARAGLEKRLDGFAPVMRRFSARCRRRAAARAA